MRKQFKCNRTAELGGRNDAEEDMVGFVERMKFSYAGNAKAFYEWESVTQWPEEFGECTWDHDAVVELLLGIWSES